MSQQIKILTVSDLHRSKSLYGQLANAVKTHRPDLLAVVGDFLHAFPTDDSHLTIFDAVMSLANLPVGEIVFVRGNHEDSALWEFADEWRIRRGEFHLLDKQTFVYGPLVLVGFPCLLGTLAAQGDGFPAKWLPPLIRPFGAAGRVLWLMHEPVYGTPLSKKDGVLAGNIEWTEAVERNQPQLVIFGHDHETPDKTKQWRHVLDGGTVCLNVGQGTDLHFAVITLDFESATPSVPTAIRIAAFPNKQTLNIHPKKTSK